MPPLTLPAPRRLYPSGPGTVKLGELDSFRPLPSRVQMAAVAAQSVVAGSRMVMSASDSGVTVMVHAMLLPRHCHAGTAQQRKGG